MAWGFNRVGAGPWSHKNPLQLQQEPAVVLMQGGGFQVDNQPTRSGHIVDAIIETCGQVASTIARLGAGLIGAAYGPLATQYLAEHRPALRHFIGDLAQRLFPEPAVVTDAPSCVDIALRRTADGCLSLHLLNLAEAQRDSAHQSPDFIPPIGPIAVRMALPEKPLQVTWQPGANPSTGPGRMVSCRPRSRRCTYTARWSSNDTERVAVAFPLSRLKRRRLPLPGRGGAVAKRPRG